MNFLLIAEADAAATEAANAAMGGMSWFTILWLVAIIAFFYFFMIRPQKKRDKEIREMRSNLQIGDEVITTGGIIGIVVSLKEDTLVIETGSDRSKIRIARWAVAQNNTVHDA